MKKAVILGREQAGLVEVPTPEPRGDWALVKVHVTPMCTEYKAWLAGERAEFLGHEAVGEVAAVAQPGRVKVGDRVIVLPQYPCGRCAHCLAGDYVYCEDDYYFSRPDVTREEREGSATYAQYVCKPDWLLPAIPEGVTYERAGLALCALGPSFGAMQRIGLNTFDTVLITGAGPVGLGAVVNARFLGARVIVVESVPYRVERLRKMGVEQVLDPRDEGTLRRIRELTGGHGVDCAVECAGVAAAQRLCIDAARRRGRIAFVGECYQDLAIRVSPDMIRKGLMVVGSWFYNRGDVSRVLRVIQESPLVDLLTSHVLPMSRIQEALALSASHETAKVLLKPWE